MGYLKGHLAQARSLALTTRLDRAYVNPLAFATRVALGIWALNLCICHDMSAKTATKFVKMVFRHLCCDNY